EAGKAARRVGEIQQKLGEHAAAEDSFRQALQVLDGLAGDDATDQELATTENRVGWLQWTLGQSPDVALARALALGLAMAQRTSGSAQSRQELARTYSSQGVIHAAYGRMAEATEAHQRALSLRQALVHEFPDATDYRRDLARTHSNLVSV